MKILALLLSMTAVSMAEISWQQKTITLQVHPTQVTADAEFHFSNDGTEPATISDVIITCGCMTAKPTKKIYAAGEEGSLTVTLNLRNREGEVRKMVMVRTGDGKEHILTLVADIPKAYEMTSPLVRWGKADDSMEKTVHLHNPNDMPIRLLSITSSDEAIPAELKTVRDGFEYDVVVRRTPEAKNIHSVIRITTEPPAGLKNSKTLKLYALAP